MESESISLIMIIQNAIEFTEQEAITVLEMDENRVEKVQILNKVSEYQ